MRKSKAFPLGKESQVLDFFRRGENVASGAIHQLAHALYFGEAQSVSLKNRRAEKLCFSEELEF